MRCEEIKKQLTEYLLDKASLSPERQSEIERHLATCAGCQGELAGLRETLGVLNQVQPLEDSEERIVKVMDMAKVADAPELWRRSADKVPKVRTKVAPALAKRLPREVAPPPQISAKRILPWAIGAAIAALILLAFIIILSHRAGKEPPESIRGEPEIARRKPPAIQEPRKAPAKITEAERRRRAEEAVRKIEEDQQRARETAERARLERERQRQEALEAAEAARQAARRKAWQEAERRQEAERQHREQEAQRKREAEQKYLAQEKKRFNEFLSTYKNFIKNYQFSKAIKLCEDSLKDNKSKTYREKVAVYLDEAQRQHQIFNYLLKKLTSGPERTLLDLGLMKVWIVKADETGFEGHLEKQPEAVYSKRWHDIEPQLIYNLFDINKLDYENRLNLAIFCYDHNLIRKADLLLMQYYRHYPGQKALVNNLLARKKGIAVPSGGFVVYRRQWVTPEEKSYMERGYIKYNGKWMTYNEVMAAKGYVKYEGKWYTKEKVARLKAARERLLAMKKLYTPTGIINKPGADTEKLSWDQHCTKESDHYIVKTNLSEDALNDIVYVMECLYYNHKKNFNVTKEPTHKLPVYVCRTRQGYNANGGPGGSGGVFMGGGRGGRKLMTFYQPPGTTGVLLHEGTHQFVSIVMNISPPIWVNEGLATFYECSKFEGRELKINLINRSRLRMIKQMISSNSHMPLRDFINISQRQFNIQCYAQSWSLVYYLVNAKGGRYALGFTKYWDELKKGGISQRNINAAKHIEMFERVFGIPIDDMETEWKEYIMSLK